MNHDYHHEHAKHSDSLVHELLHHFPYAVFSVALSLVILSFVSNVFGACGLGVAYKSADSLFHSLHFLHIVFSATGTVLTFLRFSSRPWWVGVLVGMLSPIFFCTLSDAVLPYLGGRMLGVPMHWHLCFYSEIANILPFLLIGILNGFILGHHHASSLTLFSIRTHSVHVLISSLASSFYWVAHGFSEWSLKIGIVFAFLLIAVLIPCTASDVVVPMIFSRRQNK